MAERGLFVVRGAVRRLHRGMLEDLRGKLEGWNPEGGPPGWGIDEGDRPEVEPPDPEGPIIPGEPDSPEVWPPFEIMPPIAPLPEYFYVAVYHQNIGLRWVKLHVGTMRERLQALKDRLPAGGIVGRPPQSGNRPPA